VGGGLVSRVNSAEVALPLRRVKTNLRPRLNGKIMHFEFSSTLEFFSCPPPPSSRVRNGRFIEQLSRLVRILACVLSPQSKG
jgi:hypothetical protein